MSITPVKFSLSLGMGSLCFLREAIYPLIASAAIFFASWRFLPQVIQPGKDGTMTVNPPSGSGRKMA